MRKRRKTRQDPSNREKEDKPADKCLAIALDAIAVAIALDEPALGQSTDCLN